MAYLLWTVLVGGGLFLGVGAVRVLVEQGFDLALVLIALLYLGSALYALPRLLKLIAASFTGKES